MPRWEGNPRTFGHEGAHFVQAFLTKRFFLISSQVSSTGKGPSESH